MEKILIISVKIATLSLLKTKEKGKDVTGSSFVV